MDARRPSRDGSLPKRGSRPVRIAVLKPDPSRGSQSGPANLTDEDAGEVAADEYAEKAKEITMIIRERFCQEGLSLPSKSAGNAFSCNVVGSESEVGESSALSEVKNKLSERLKMIFRISEDVGPVGEGSTIEETVANSTSELKPENVNTSVGLNRNYNLPKDSEPEEPQTGASSGYVVPSDSLVAGIPHHAVAEDSDECGDPYPGGFDRVDADLLGVIEDVLKEMRKFSVGGSKLHGKGVCHIFGFEEEEETEWFEALLLICMEVQELLLNELLEEAIGMHIVLRSFIRRNTQHTIF